MLFRTIQEVLVLLITISKSLIFTWPSGGTSVNQPICIETVLDSSTK